MQFILFIAVVILLVFGLLAVQNPTTVVTFKFIKWTLSDSLTITLAASFGAGIVTGILLFGPAWWKKTKQTRADKKRIQELEGELLNAVERTSVVEPAGESENKE